MTVKSKVTPIVRGNMNTLRYDVTKALQDVMAKHGLKANVGRIVFEPGREFRCKLTVVQPAAEMPQGLKPKVDESWSFAGKTYSIVEVHNDEVIGSRLVNTRRFGLTMRQFRIKMVQIMAAGVKVSK